MVFKVGIWTTSRSYQCFLGLHIFQRYACYHYPGYSFWFLFLVLCLFCLSQKPRRVKTIIFLPYICMPMKPSRTLWDLSRQIPPLCPHFVFVGNSLCSASLNFPECQRADSNSCLSGNGRKQRWRKIIKKLKRLKQDLVPSQGNDITISLSSKAFTKVRMVTKFSSSSDPQ